MAAGVLAATAAAWWVLARPSGTESHETAPALPSALAPPVEPAFEVTPRPPEPSEALSLSAADVAPPASAPAAAGASEATTSAPLQLEIGFPDGAPARGATVVLARDELVLDRGVTDRTGRLSLAGGDEPASLHVAGVGHELHSESIESPRGTVRVTLAGAARLSGTATVNGTYLGPRLVALSVRPASRAQKRARLPDAIEQALKGPAGEWGDRHGRNVQRVRDEGRFDFSGLVAGEAYFIELPSAYLSADRLREISVTAPAENLRLDLIETPAVRGRAVDGLTLLPIPSCSVQCTVNYDVSRPTYYAVVPTEAVIHASPGSISRTFAADDEGRFRVVLERPVASMTLDLFDTATGGRTQVQVEGIDDVAGKNLGDVPVEPARVVSFRVIDSGGMPITGALAIEDGERELRSQPTGADGLGELPGLPAGDISLAFTAAGYDTTHLVVSGQGDVMLEVQLLRCAQLEVQVLSHAVDWPEGLMLRLSADEKAFTGGEEFGPEAVRHELGATRYSEMSVSTISGGPALVVTGQIRYDLPESGQLSISCLRPGVEMQLCLVGSDGEARSLEQSVVLANGEQRRVELWLTDAR